MHLEEQAESYLLYLTVLLEDNQYYSEVLLEPKKLLLTITSTLHFGDMNTSFPTQSASKATV